MSRYPKPSTIERTPEEHVNWPASVPFLLVHLLPFLAVFTGIT
ncbi:MAG: hypothetical protein RL531_1847, partial [Actinomycetota bacterium]